MRKGAFAARPIGRSAASDPPPAAPILLDEIGDLPLRDAGPSAAAFCPRAPSSGSAAASPSPSTRESCRRRCRFAPSYRHQPGNSAEACSIGSCAVSQPAALRSTPDDILLLANFFLQRFPEEIKRDKLDLSPRRRHFCMSYPWPGNLRGFIASLRRAVVMEERRQSVSSHSVSTRWFGKGDHASHSGSQCRARQCGSNPSTHDARA